MLRAGMSRLAPSVDLPTFSMSAGRVSSNVFLVLALILHSLEYPPVVVLGQLLQYRLSVAVWSPPVDGLVLWCDRCTALVNVCLLGAAHYQRGVSLQVMLALFPLAFVCKSVDWCVAHGDNVTVWYLCWHGSLFVLNLGLGLWTM